MPKPPRRPPTPRARKTDVVVADRVAGRSIVAKPADPRQAGLFDVPLPSWIKPCLPTLVDTPPIGPNWVHEIKWDGYRIAMMRIVATGEKEDRHDRMSGEGPLVPQQLGLF